MSNCMDRRQRTNYKHESPSHELRSGRRQNGGDRSYNFAVTLRQYFYKS